MVLSAVDTTSVSSAAIREPIAVSTTTHRVVAFVLIWASLEFMFASLAGGSADVADRNSAARQLRSLRGAKSIARPAIP